MTLGHLVSEYHAARKIPVITKSALRRFLDYEAGKAVVDLDVAQAAWASANKFRTSKIDQDFRYRIVPFEMPDDYDEWVAEEVRLEHR